MRHPSSILFLAAALAGLSGCSWFGHDANLVCPRAEIVAELATITPVAPEAGSSPSSPAGRMTGIASTCRKTDTAIVTDLEIDVTATRSAAGAVKLPYLVGVIDANRTVLSESTYDIAVDAGSGPRISKERITVTIPTYDPGSGGNFAILAGFKLSQEQLAYNRAHPQ